MVPVLIREYDSASSISQWPTILAYRCFEEDLEMVRESARVEHLPLLCALRLPRRKGSDPVLLREVGFDQTA